MYILKSTPTAEGQYGPILNSNQPVPPEGYVWWPDSVDQTDFIQYLGFIVPNIKRNTVASYTVNMEAYNDWVESHPDPEPVPEPGPTGDYATWDEIAAAYMKGVQNA